MATSPSDVSFTIVGGGTPTPQEVAAIAAALEVVLSSPAEPPPVNRWRWSGRWWQENGLGAAPDWRWSGPTTHPSSR